MRFERLVLAVLAGCLVVMSSTYYVAAQRHAPLTMKRLYTGSDGLTHTGNVEVALTPSSRYAGVEESEVLKASGAQFLRLPPGNVQDWHNATRRQYAITLSGRGEVELAGGQKILLNPGQIVLAEDVTGKGHITRATGSEDLVLLLVAFAAQ